MIETFHVIAPGVNIKGATNPNRSLLRPKRRPNAPPPTCSNDTDEECSLTISLRYCLRVLDAIAYNLSLWRAELQALITSNKEKQ